MLRRLLVSQVLMGFGIWLGMSPTTVSIHSTLGSLFVVVLWAIGLMALVELPKRSGAVFTLLWGGLLLWLGRSQAILFVGSGHWIIRVAHLVVGLAALGLVEALGVATKRHRVASHAADASSNARTSRNSGAVSWRSLNSVLVNTDKAPGAKCGERALSPRSERSFLGTAAGRINTILFGPPRDGANDGYSHGNCVFA